MFKICLLAVIYLVVFPWEVVSAEDVECFKAPPGVAKMARGVDIAQLDVLPLDFTSADGFKSPIIKFTCDEGRKYRKGSVNYQKPDQIWHMTRKPGGWLGAVAHLYRTSSDLRSRMVKNVGGEGPIWKFGFSASGSFSKVQYTLTHSAKYIADVSSLYSSTRVDLKPPRLLSMTQIAKRHVKKYVANHTYRSNPQVYHEFIEQFGTHYFSVANFGGYIRSVLETSVHYFESRTEEEVNAEARADFLGLISAQGGESGQSTAVGNHFKAISNRKVIFYGGSTNLQSPGGIQTWQSTVDDNPWLLSGELKPISDLFGNEVQRAGMREAVRQHVMQAYLEELRRLLRTARSRQGSSDAAHDEELEGRLAAMEALPLGSLVEEDLETLGQAINDRLTVLAPAPVLASPEEPENNKSRNSAVGLGPRFGQLLLTWSLVIIVLISTMQS